MIIKSSARGYAGSLAKHLGNREENERVLVTNSRGLALENNQNIREALIDLNALSSPQKKGLYHVMMNPDQSLTSQEWSQVWQEYEGEYNLQQQQFIEVTHEKKGRLHRHRIYNRIQDDGKGINTWHNYLRNEKIARKLEYLLNHQITVGKHNRAVVKQLAKEGHHEIVQWLNQHQAQEQSRPVAQKNHADRQQEQKTQISVEQVKNELQAAYQATDNGRAFEAAIAEKGYLLAKGDRRDFVIVDPMGEVHSPRRRLGVKAKELRQRWHDIKAEQLPTVEQVKNRLNPERQAKQEWQSKDLDEQIAELSQECQLRQQKLEQLKEKLREQPREDSAPELVEPELTESATQASRKQKNLRQQYKNRLTNRGKRRRILVNALLNRRRYLRFKQRQRVLKAQKLEQSTLQEPLDVALEQSQAKLSEHSNSGNIVQSQAEQRTAESLLPNVLPKSDDDRATPKPEKGQGDKQVTDSAQNKDKRQEIEVWTQYRKGEGRDSIKPLIREAVPSRYHQITDETVIPTNGTALTETGFFHAPANPDPPAKYRFAKIWKGTLAKITMSKKKLLTTLKQALSETKQYYQAQKAATQQKKALEKSQKEEQKEQKIQQKLDLIEQKTHKTANDYQQERKLRENALKKNAEKTRRQTREELKQFLKENPQHQPDKPSSMQKADQWMARIVGQYSHREQQLIRDLHQHKKVETQKQEHFKTLDNYAAQIKAKAPPEKHQEIDNYVNARKELINNPHWSAHSRISEAGHTEAWNEAMSDSIQALEDAQQNPDKRLSAAQEYRAELARSANYHNLTEITRQNNPSNAIENDKLIAVKMYASGRSKSEIYHAVREASPNVADLSAQEGHMYVQQQIDPALDSQIAEKWRDKTEQIREREHISFQEQRLDKLNLAEDREPKAREANQSSYISLSSAEADSGAGY